VEGNRDASAWQLTILATTERYRVGGLVQPAALHVLTPGSPAYALAKVGAIGGLVALRVVMARRERARREPEPEAAPPPERRPQPHPVSRRKQRRKRR
jgi:hypothetical protein